MSLGLILIPILKLPILSKNHVFLIDLLRGGEGEGGMTIYILCFFLFFWCWGFLWGVVIYLMQPRKARRIFRHKVPNLCEPGQKFDSFSH